MQSPYKRTESNLLAEEKGLHNLGQVVVWIIHLCLYIYFKIVLIDINHVMNLIFSQKKNILPHQFIVNQIIQNLLIFP